MNSNQEFTCFYTDNKDAFDDFGLPNGDFPPNFDAIRRTELNSGDGIYKVKLRGYKGK